MKHTNKFLGLLLTLSFITNLTAQQNAGGWIELINGNDFTGWKASENEAT